MGNHSVLLGATHEDERGKLLFFKTLDLSQIKRMYQIEPANESVIRAWQGHKVEKKWFYCLQGSFIINLVKVTNFEHPDTDATISKKIISSNTPTVLYVEGGYASGIKATLPNSKVLVFSNFTTAQSKYDDFRFEPHFWKAQWNL